MDVKEAARLEGNPAGQLRSDFLRTKSPVLRLRRSTRIYAEDRRCREKVIIDEQMLEFPR